MKLWNRNVCITSPLSIAVLITLLFSSLIIASSVMTKGVVEECIQDEEMWVPTKDDIAYQDSMYSIIQNTQNDITDIKQDIVYIIERLDYEDGTWDSIRYVKGGKIDKRRN